MALQKPSPGLSPVENYARFGIAFDAVDANTAAIAALNAATDGRLDNLEGSALSQEQRLDQHDNYLATLASGISGHTQQLSSLFGANVEIRQIQADHLAQIDGLTGTVTASLAQSASAIAYASHGRPGDTPGAYTRDGTGRAVTDLAPLDPTTLSTTPAGRSAVLSGEDQILTRAGTTAEAGRRYEIRWRIRRDSTPTDPANDGVALGVTVYDRFGARLGGGAGDIVFATLVGMISGQVEERTTIVSRTPGTGIGITLGDDAQVMVRPYARQYGSATSRTQVEVLSIRDITDAGAYSPDLTALTARVGSLEAGNFGPRLAAVEAATTGPKRISYATLDGAAASTPPSTATYLEIRGALYRRAASGQFQTADGAWWDLAPLVLDQRDGPVLTLAQGNYLPTLEYINASTVYVNPGLCDLVGLLDGGQWIGHRVSELAVVLTTAHAAGSIHDVLLWFDAATNTLRAGTVAWAGASRGTGGNTAEIELFQGRWVNRNPVTARNGNSTYAVPARAGLLIGSIGITTLGLTEDSFTKRLVSSVWDRRPREMARRDPAYSWIYSGAAFVQANNGNGFNALEYLHTLPGRSIEVDVVDACSTSTATPIAVSCNIGLDSTAPIAQQASGAVLALPGVTFTMRASWKGAPGLGRRRLLWLEYAAYDPAQHTGSAQTWLGTAGTFQSGITAWI